MSAAREDWEATCCIYDNPEVRTVLDKDGCLLRGSIELEIPLANLVFCRRSTDDQYRFWTDDKDLRLRLDFWCTSSPNDERNDYQRVDVTLKSNYPPSFPPKEPWMNWIHKEASKILHTEQLSYSVCLLVEHRAMEYFTCLYQDHERNLDLILFEDDGPKFYDRPTLVADQVKQVLPLQRHSTSRTVKTVGESSELSETELSHILPILIQWKDWLPITCPICFDLTGPMDAVVITCGHSFCRECITMYLRIKTRDEINSENRRNPFVCPLTSCNLGMKIVGCVKQFLDDDLMDKVREWYKDVKNPPCWSLPHCLKRSCQGQNMRHEEVDSYVIYCECCKGKWCELCLKRVPKDDEHPMGACHADMATLIQFCERYLVASDEAKRRCEEKWPWITVHAKSRIHDPSAARWISQNGQVCPGCRLGIERLEGCFHMKCKCGTHFCYECGEELFAPFYSTHHCWERQAAGMFG